MFMYNEAASSFWRRKYAPPYRIVLVHPHRTALVAFSRYRMGRQRQAMRTDPPVVATTILSIPSIARSGDGLRGLSTPSSPFADGSYRRNRNDCNKRILTLMAQAVRGVLF